MRGFGDEEKQKARHPVGMSEANLHERDPEKTAAKLLTYGSPPFKPRWCSVAGMTMVMCVLLIFAFASHARAQDITTGLVSHWKLDETSGTSVVDSAGTSTGTMGGGMSADNDAVQGRISGALNFDGNNDYFTAANESNFDFTSSFSISVWMRADGWVKQYAGLVTKGAAFTFDRNASTDGIRMTVAGVANGAVLTGTNVADGEWHNIVGVFNDTEDKLFLYVDGVLKSTQSTVTGTPSTNDIDLVIGKNGSIGSREFRGDLDEVRIYSRALSDMDIVTLAAATFPGKIRYNANARVPEYHDGYGWIAMGPSQYVPNAVSFDGANDYLDLGTGLTGVSDSKKVTGSFWFRRDGDFGLDQTIFREENNDFRFKFLAANTLRIDADEAVTDLNLITIDSSTTVTDTNWHHALFSFDLTGGDHTVTGHLYIDDVDAKGSVFDFVDGLINFDRPIYTVGSDNTPAQFYNGNLADLWVDIDTYIDFSIEANRRKFIDADGNPVYLGTDGSKPTGGVPDVFLSGDTADWHTNKGTGGGFTENGALTDSLTRPGATGSPVKNGLVGWWKMDESSGDITDVINFNSGVSSGGPTYAQTGKAGNAIDFDGSDDVFTINHNGVLDDLNQITLTAWIYPRSLGEGGNLGRVIDKSPVNNDFLWSLNGPGNEHFQFQARRWSGGDATWNSPDNSIQFNQWQHLAVTYDYSATSNDPKFYINGQSVTVSDGAGQPSGTVTSQPGEMFIGNSDSTIHTFDGLIDDVRIYSRVLNAEEVQQIFEWGEYSGPSCTNPARDIGTIIYNAASNVPQFCDGEQWQAMGPVPGAGGGGPCSNPSRPEGSLIYNEDYGVVQYCDGTDWVAVGKEPPSGPTGCDNIGDLCSDGSYYIGDIGAGKVYATAAASESSESWDDGTQEDDPADSTTDGAGNTVNLVADQPPPHDAAAYCNGLSAHGYSTGWYLPAQDELNLFWNSGAPVAGVLTDGSYYWSSTEASTLTAWRQRFSDGAQVGNSKSFTYAVRCVRR